MRSAILWRAVARSRSKLPSAVGSGSPLTRRWSKGDSNSPSHPERQRSEGRHMGPAHRSRFRSHAAVIVTLAALPILWTPNVVVARKVVGGFRVAIPGALLFAADGWIATGYVFVWQIALTRCRATRPRGSPGLAQTLAPLAGNRGFESTSLQRRVSCEPDSSAQILEKARSQWRAWSRVPGSAIFRGTERSNPGFLHQRG